MNLVALTAFIPLVVGFALAYYLIFKQNLPSEGILSILTYFIGILIVFVAVGYIITQFFAGWATDLLNAGTTSEWQVFINTSSAVVESAFGTENESGSGGNPVPYPTATSPTVIIVTATPAPGQPSNPSPPPSGSTTYTVMPGDTLYGIAAKYGTTVDAIMQANNLTSWTIYPGQVLTIP